MHDYCKDCPRNSHAARRIDGDGPVDAEVLVLIAQPDHYDDQARRPATGKYGVLLKKLVGDAGLANLVRYELLARCYDPGQDRHPETEACHACWPFVEDYLKLHPMIRIIVALGQKPMKACGVEGTANDVYGTRVETFIAGRKVVVIPMHDAETIMHDPNLVSTWLGYWHGIRRILNDLACMPKVVTPEWPDEGQMFLDHIENLVGFDIETNTLNPDEKSSTILSWAVSDGHMARAMSIRDPRQLRSMLRCIEGITPIADLAMHHGAFDIMYTERFTGYEIPTDHVWDTFLLAYRVDPGQPHDLHSVTTRHLADKPEILGYKLDTGGGIKQAWKLGQTELLSRNGLDAYATYHLVAPLKARLAPEVTPQMLAEDVALSVEMARIAQRGLFMSYDTMVKLREKNEKVKADALVAVQAINVKYGVDAPVNPQSSKQVGEFLNHVLRCIGNHNQLNTTDKGNPETGEIPLRVLAHDVGHPDIEEAVKQIIEYRSAVKTNGTNIKGYGERIGHDGRLRSDMRWPGTVSWRAASSNPNLQNVPRDNEVRKMFAAPPGKIMWECDYGQIELRIAATLSQDPVLCHVFKSGGDAHTLLAQRIFYSGQNVKPTKLERDRAKTTNFGLLYGAGVMTLWEQFVKDGIFIDVQEVSKYHSTFWNTYQGLAVYVNTQMARARAGQYLYAPVAGYRWCLGDMRFLHGQDIEEACRSIFNSTIQSVPPRYTLRAARAAEKDPAMQQHGFEITHQTHDGLMGYVNDTPEGRSLVTKMKDYMDAQTLEPWWQGVPCRAAAKVGPSWGELADL